MKFTTDIEPIKRWATTTVDGLILCGICGFLLLVFTSASGVAVTMVFLAGLARPIGIFLGSDIPKLVDSYVELTPEEVAYYRPSDGYRFARSYESIEKVRYRSFFIFYYVAVDFSPGERFRFWWSERPEYLAAALSSRAARKEQA